VRQVGQLALVLQATAAPLSPAAPLSAAAATLTSNEALKLSTTGGLSF
jgi:hypothetical protein